MKRSLRTATAQVAVAASAIALTVLGAGAASAKVVPHDPNCPVGEYGSPGNISYTATFYSNPCNRQVRAWIKCASSTQMGYTYYQYGQTLIGQGNSTAGCGILDGIDGYGHQVYYNGAWATYNG